MTNRELTSGGFRAWGVVWLIYAVGAMPQLLVFLRSRPFSSTDRGMETVAFWSYGISIATSLVVGFLLIRLAPRIAAYVFPVEQNIGLALDAASLQAVLFSVIGVYLVATGLRGAMVAGFGLLDKPSGNTQRNAEYLWYQNKEALIRSAAELIVGALLFFGARGLQGLWQRYRRGGAPAEPAPSDLTHEA